jgi:Winged helix DNA-binding domain
LNLAQVGDAGRSVLAEAPRTPGQLGAALQQRWPDREAGALANAVRNLVPLIQLPPRGVWGSAGKTTYATAEDWLGRPLVPRPSLDQLLLRYLAAFGPATVTDMKAWSGLTRLTESVERLRPGLMAFRDESGHELFDVPEAPRPDPDTPVAVRLLAEFDNVLLSHSDRSRIVSEPHRKRVMTVNGLVLGSLLVDGFIAGTWRINRAGGDVRLTIQPFVRLTQKDRQEASAEGTRLLQFVEGGAGGPVEFAPVVR